MTEGTTFSGLEPVVQPKKQTKQNAFSSTRLLESFTGIVPPCFAGLWGQEINPDMFISSRIF